MNFKYLAIPALATASLCLASCQSMMDWADRNMPTYNSKPTPAAAPQPPQAQGFKLYQPPQAFPSKGMTPVQASSAYDGGTTRPLLTSNAPAPKMPPQGNTYVVTPATPPAPPKPAPTGMVPPPPPAFAPPAPPTSMDAPAPSSGRRAPAGQLPPSAIQPSAYGQQAMRPAAAPAAPGAKADDFPIEYKKSGAPSFDSNQDPMIPAPPI